ncbi:very low-density lipoprotein receptor-like, partial [Clarias magur]
DAAAVIFSSSEGIMWMKPDGSELRKITNTTGTSGALTSLTADNTLYWTQHTHIYRLVLDAGHLEPMVMFSGVTGIVGLAVDWINRVLYWTSTSTGAVHAAALNGTEHHALISGLQSPGAVAIQSLAGFLFWTDTGDSPRIERSDLNGQNRRTLVSSAIHNPVSITLDVPRGLLYWADSSLRTVSRVTYDGWHRKTVMESNSHLDQPFGLAVFEDAVYWSDRATGAICSADKHTGNLLKVSHLSEASSPAGLLLHHPLLQPTDMTTSQTSPSPMDPDSAFSFSRVLFLIVFPSSVLSCVVFAALLACWRKGTFSSSRSRFPEEPVLKESQDPLITNEDNRTHTNK